MIKKNIIRHIQLGGTKLTIYNNMLLLNGGTISSDSLSKLLDYINTYNITCLNLKNSNFDDYSLKHISKNNSINKLYLGGNNLITDTSIKYLLNNDNLEVLDISYTGVSQSMICNIIQKTKLKELFVGRTPINENFLKIVSSNNSIERLDISGTSYSNESILSLCKNKSFKGLGLFKTNIQSDTIEIISSMPKLEELNIGHFLPNSDSDFQALSNMKLLSKLNLFGCNFTDTSVKYINKLENLTSLNIRNNDLSRKGVKSIINGIPALNNIQIDYESIPEKQENPHVLINSLKDEEKVINDMSIFGVFF